MSLLKSLFCFRGYDNGRRFLTISASCYLLFILLSSAIVQAKVLLVLLLIIGCPILLAASIRRIHDAGFATPLAAMPPLIFVFCTVTISLIQHQAVWFLMVLAILVTLAMATVSNARKRRNTHYTYGYAGPIDLTASPQDTATPLHQRIEPTISTVESLPSREMDLAALAAKNATPSGANIIEPGNVSRDSKNNINNNNNNNNNVNRGDEPCSINAARAGVYAAEAGADQWPQLNRTQLMIGAGVLLALTGLFWFIFSATDNQRGADDTQQVPVELAKQRLYKIEMPDNFWIMLDENSALTIAWQGDFRDDGTVWSALTGQGEVECNEISFTTQASYKTMQVTVKNSGDYYADFSPVDTKNLVQAIGLKDKFELCGYEFSLKGTQAVLMTNRNYATFFE